MNEQKQQGKSVITLSAPQILQFLISDDPLLDNLIIFRSSEVQIDMTEASLYSAIAAVQPYDQFKLNKLAKLLEVAHVHHGHKHIATHELVEEIRKKALQPNERRNAK